MKYGVNTLIWTGAFDRSHLALLPRLRDWGFDGVEISVFSLAGFPTGETRKALEEHGLECTFCSALSGGCSAIAEDESARRAARVYLEDCIKTAADLGAKLFSGPFYSPVGSLAGRRRTEQEWQREVELLQALGDTLEHNGVTLAIEPLNRFETYFLNLAADAVELCRQVNHPRVGVLLDTFHMNIEEKDLAAAIRCAAPYLKNVHACENDRGTPGTGHIGWREVFAALRSIDYAGWMVIESFAYTVKEIATAACVWRDLAASPERIAVDGVGFLRRSAAL